MMPTRSASSVAASPAVQQSRCPGLALTTLDHGRVCELHITLTPLPGEDWAAGCRRLHDVLRDEDATIASLMAWGDFTVRDGALASLKREFGRIAWPVTWTEGADPSGGTWSGLQGWAVRGVKPEPVEIEGEILACQYRDEYARRVLLGGLGPRKLTATRADQTAHSFERLEVSLAHVGLNMSHVVRTWFFLDDILSWYGDFNKVRTEFFRSRRVFEGLVPASTGVGTRNPRRAAVALAALAVQSITGRPLVREIASPAQCPATAYGSSFSRAVEIQTNRCRHVIVSGTASIEPGGMSVRPNDWEGQIELTFRVIGDILESRGLDYNATSRAVAYFKDKAGARIFGDWLARQGLRNLPIVATVAAVCREELLFELELDAAAGV
jgi:enamine deaminase RidA (YjgF/YER057c/UK114 family)